VRYYIASGFANKAAHNKLRDFLQSIGWQITYDWTVLERATLDNARQIADAEKQGVKDAEFVFVILPGGRGTYTEFGIAIGRDTPVLMIGDEGGFRQGATYEVPCVFHHTSGVRRVTLPFSPLFGKFEDFIGTSVKKLIAWAMGEMTPGQQAAFGDSDALEVTAPIDIPGAFLIKGG